MKKVLVAASGGVDSSVAIYVLQQQGYQVAAATFDLTGNQNIIAEAKAVCSRLNVPHYVLDYKRQFQRQVTQNFLEEYLQGRTPNPCVVCNKHIKFGAFLDSAKQLGYDYIATGHYAKIITNPTTQRFVIKQADYLEKDQSYMFYTLSQQQLSHIILPLGSYRKEQVREIARNIGLAAYDKKDSQDICFIPDKDYIRYIEQKIGKNKMQGNFIDKSGKILGKHKGIYAYTIGQRKGLGLSFGKPMFVCRINPDDCTILLSDEQELFYSTVIARDVNFLPVEKLIAPTTAMVKLRYSHKPAPAVITSLDDNSVKIVFDTPQRAPTKGQSAVFYQNDCVLGGGIVEDMFMNKM